MIEYFYYRDGSSLNMQVISQMQRAWLQLARGIKP